jgi:hypothetical protein
LIDGFSRIGGLAPKQIVVDTQLRDLANELNRLYKSEGGPDKLSGATKKALPSIRTRIDPIRPLVDAGLAPEVAAFLQKIEPDLI